MIYSNFDMYKFSIKDEGGADEGSAPRGRGRGRGFRGGFRGGFSRGRGGFRGGRGNIIQNLISIF